VKTLVVYYSFEGNCALVAEELKSSLGAAGLEIKTLDEKKREGFAKFFWGGMQVFMKKKPALKPFSFNPDDWDLIVLGSPVWAGAPAPPMVSFLEGAKIRDKKTAFFCCHAGGKGGAMEKFTRLLTGNTVLGGIDFENPLKGNREELRARISAWAKTLG
jgi:flavodoxin